MNTQLTKSFIAIAMVFFASLSQVTVAAPVKTISLEVFKDAETPLWEVSVSCENVAKPRTMSKAIDGAQWCSSDIASLCDENKFSLSRQLCSDNFTQQLVDFKNGKSVSAPALANSSKPQRETTKTTEPVIATAPAKLTNKKSKIEPTKLDALSKNAINPVASRDNLLKEQMQIEEQRILIQQKRLELRRRELTLQKRQLNAS